jgi:hypothetical protein
MQPRQRGPRSVIEFVLLLLISLFLFNLGFRFISIPFFLLWIYVYWFTSGQHYMRRLVVTWLQFLGTLFIPVDIDIGGWHGPRRGVSSGGVHCVRFVKGLPAHARLIEKYGEYISGGCVGGGLEPTWILVWN